MKNTAYIFSILILLILNSCTGTKMVKQTSTEYNKLFSEEKRVIIDKETEIPYTGKYCKFDEKGTFLCKQCNAPLFRSEDKFDSGCGWPSFDTAINGAIKEIPDRDEIRTEIVCANCGAHLGHVFTGEGFTSKDVRHCVNSISMQFLPDNDRTTEKAYFAGGCFWGVEFYFNQSEGVISTTAGYSGGDVPHPSYNQVSTGNTGYAETVEVEFNPSKTTFEKLARLFFEIHDPAQTNGQGHDIGSQYLSYIFYTTVEQKKTSEKLIKILKEKGYSVVTKVTPLKNFWPAESFHQDYYSKTGKTPYCHIKTKRF